MKVGIYECPNDEKLDRAINGVVVSGGKKTPGVGLDATDEQILVAYDKLGGLILKDGLKVKSGCFYDIEEKKAFDKPEPVYEVSIDEALVEVTEDEAKGLQAVQKKKEELKAKAKGNPKGKKLRRKKKEVKEEPKDE